MMNRLRLSLAISALLAAAAVFAQESDADLVPHHLDERQPLQTVVPVYPERALEQRLQGKVEVCFNVDREGRTSRIAVRTSSNRVFEKPAILAVRASSYMPLPADKKMSGIKTCRTFRFLLDPVAITDPSEELAAEP
ncbi:MAG: energy transducer TonB [Woeseiaceae bacterium]